MTDEEKEEDREIPNPGSPEAIDRGCRCPVLDNAHGVGYFGVPGRWVYSGDCPLHSPNLPEHLLSGRKIDGIPD